MTTPTVTPTTQHYNADEFQWVDSAIGAMANRNHVVRWADFRPPADQDALATVALYQSGLVDYCASHSNANGNPTVAGYDGPGHIRRVYLDFDNATDPGAALDDARRFVRDRCGQLGIAPGAIVIRFSGSKGCRVELPASLFGGFTPAIDIEIRHRRVVEMLVEDQRWSRDQRDQARYPSLDWDFYSKLRLSRVENAKHGKTGLFAIPLTVDELMTLSIAEIRELAATPRHLDRPPDDEWLPIPSLVQMREAAEAFIESPPDAGGHRWRSDPRPRPEPAVWDTAVTLLADNLPDEGRHMTFGAVAGVMGVAGFDTADIADLLREAAELGMDEEGKERAKHGEFDRLADDTIRKLEDNERVHQITGGPTLAACIGVDAAIAFQVVLGILPPVAEVGRTTLPPEARAVLKRWAQRGAHINDKAFSVVARWMMSKSTHPNTIRDVLGKLDDRWSKRERPYHYLAAIARVVATGDEEGVRPPKKERFIEAGLEPTPANALDSILQSRLYDPWPPETQGADLDVADDEPVDELTYEVNLKDDEDGDTPSVGLPYVSITDQHLRDLTTAAIDALVAAKQDPFVQSAALVRVVENEHGRPIVSGYNESAMVGALARVADWYRIGKTAATKVTPPLAVARDILSLGVWPKFKPLAGIIEAPALRVDGTIIDVPGYDPQTRLVYRPGPNLDGLRIPEHPTSEDVKTAVALIDDILEFPFVDPASRAGTFALLLTPTVLPATGPAPLALIDGTDAGSGKTKIAAITGIIATGREPGLGALPTNEDEVEKRIATLLAEGANLIVFDNVDAVIHSPSLALALTARTFSGRVLGRSERIEAPNAACWVATGNNLTTGGDIQRRCHHIRLEPKVDKPWQRTSFRHPELEEYVKAHRSTLLGALLTLARAWFSAGCPPAARPPIIGGFTGWASTIAGILEHAGIEGFGENLNALYETSDAEGQQWSAFLHAWHQHVVENGKTSGFVMKELVATITGDQGFQAAVPDAFADALTDTRGGTRRIGKALAKRVGRRYNGYALRKQIDSHTKNVRWSVEYTPMKEDPDPSLESCGVCGVCGVSTYACACANNSVLVNGPNKSIPASSEINPAYTANTATDWEEV